MTCDGRDYQGAYCGATAILQRIDYRHGAILDARSTAYRHILRETRYQIICPKCGPRVQVEKAEDLAITDIATESGKVINALELVTDRLAT